MSKKLKNKEYPFTELFSLLRQHEVTPENIQTINYSTKILKDIYQHTDNAMEELIQGLQSLGNLAGVAQPDSEDTVSYLNEIGFFIAALSNLTEALRYLHLDTDYELRQRGEQNY